jgi:hypothetical protein
MGHLRNFQNHCFALLVIAIYIFNPAPAWAEMGQAGGNNIDAGTTITPQNWQKYRQFMSDGLIALRCSRVNSFGACPGMFVSRSVRQFRFHCPRNTGAIQPGTRIT